MHPASGKKGVVVIYIMLQLYRKVLHLRRHVSCTFQTCLVHMPDMFCMHFRCISHTFQMSENVTLELSCTVLQIITFAVAEKGLEHKGGQR